MSLNRPKQKQTYFAVRTVIVSIFVVAASFAIGAGLQSQAQSQPMNKATPPTAPSVPDLPKVYMPGLGEFMQVIQNHHAKVWLAAKARNWELAQYQLSEMKEVLDEVRELVPTYKNVPVGQMVDAIATGPIGDLEKAVEEKKFGKFAKSYDKLTEACNSCHMAASRGFIKIRRPARSTFENQDFSPARK